VYKEARPSFASLTFNFALFGTKMLSVVRMNVNTVSLFGH
jgi:hypothetical protein